ncbi:MAG: cell wall-binding protein [Clostridium butyricum]|nr:cell wall-binding protein [Clostridium butyricum]
MNKKKVKLLTMLIVALCVNGITYSVHAEEIKNSNTLTDVVSSVEEKESKVNEAINAKDSEVEIPRNWLTEEVAKQLNKELSDLAVDDFAKITKIDLHFERINDKIPEEISLMTNLEYLDLNYTKLKGSIPESLSKLTKLTYLDLGDNRLDDIEESIIKNIKDGKYAYCDVTGNQFKLYDGWYKLKGKLYYFDRWGDKATGIQEINGKEYEFNEDGFVCEGWQKNDDGTSSYYDINKGKIKSDWLLLGGKYYYFDENGVMLTGIQTINNKKYNFGTDGVMLTGVQVVDGKQVYFSNNGDMQFGWTPINGKQCYCDPTTGEIIKNEEKIIDGKKYKFLSDGSLMADKWIDGNTYININGQAISPSSTHSNTQFQLFKYLTDTNNRVSVHYRAIELHGGITSNNCVFFTSEALRRIGVNLPLGTCNTYDLEDKLQAMGWLESYDLSQLKPGDIVFTNGYTHVYVFMGWASDGNAYICDNQCELYEGKVLHLRQIYNDGSHTDRATHFFYCPY